VTITGYAGILAGPKISIETGKTGGFSSFRFGGTVRFIPKKWISFYGLAACEVNETGNVTPLYLMSIILKPSKTSLISFGKIATPMTELRPLPTTLGGQFEPWTKSHILGSAYGGKITIIPNKKVSLVAGGSWRGTDGSAELGLSVPHFKIAGYYMVRSHGFGGAAILTYPWFAQTVSYNYNETLGINTNISILKTGFSLYSDIGLDAKNWDFIHGE
jgi:hypothetical protein